MKILVTGGTGLLGNNLIRQLAASGEQVTALVRREPSAPVFAGVDVELQRGEINDAAVLARSVSNVDAVIHSAALIRLGWSQREESMRVNRDGTNNLVRACLDHACPLIHVGTVNTLAVGSRHRVADESTDLDHAGGQVPCSYVVSKRAGVAEVVAGLQRGLKAAIIHPGFMLGPWDWKPSSGQMMLEVGTRWRPFAPRGGCSVCDARDVANGIWTALQKLCAGTIENGRQYILAGQNHTYRELWREIAKRFDKAGPLFCPGPLMRWLAGCSGDVMAQIRGFEGHINSAAVRMSSQFHWHTSARAQAELAYENRPVSETIDDAYRWLREQHLRA